MDIQKSECLREKTTEERGETLLCNEVGCKLRLFPIISGSWINTDASKMNCLLQIQLRARDSENVIGKDLNGDDVILIIDEGQVKNVERLGRHK